MPEQYLVCDYDSDENVVEEVLVQEALYEGHGV
jgi:hypothetical protein